LFARNLWEIAMFMDEWTSANSASLQTLADAANDYAAATTKRRARMCSFYEGSVGSLFIGFTRQSSFDLDGCCCRDTNSIFDERSSGTGWKRIAGR